MFFLPLKITMYQLKGLNWSTWCEMEFELMWEGWPNVRFWMLVCFKRKAEKEDTHWLVFPRIIFAILQSQYHLKRMKKERLVPLVQYKNDARLGKSIYSRRKRLRRRVRRKPSRHQSQLHHQTHLFWKPQQLLEHYIHQKYSMCHQKVIRLQQWSSKSST